MKHADVTPQLVEPGPPRLLATAAALGDDALPEPSLCAGWSRGHVLAHVARNADALVRVCDVALTGAADTMYDDVESRDADIERDAHRTAADHLLDLRASAAHL